MNESSVQTLTLSDLLRRNQPLTAASSLSTTTSNRHQPSLHPQPPPRDTIPKTETLTPLGCPSILIGMVNLPPETLICPHKNCFQFSDRTSSICCDILDFSVSLIGKEIHVMAWNFIPLVHLNKQIGFLEIIKWKVPELDRGATLSRCSGFESVSLVSASPSLPSSVEKSRSRHRLYGPIELVSPVSVVPCSSSVGAQSSNVRGFVVKILACECVLCRGKGLVDCSVLVQCCHSFKKSVNVYFCGSPFWLWHSAITKLVGDIVALSGLKKKLVFIGKDESVLMFLPTENSVLHTRSSGKKWMPLNLRSGVKGEGECGVYTGVITGMYFGGMVVELDKEVWLLVTDQLLVMQHSLRVGAIVSVKNIHFVNPKFSWAKMLILGACFRTSITVESFSPLGTRCLIASHSPSQLAKYIESLTFAARIWLLLVISCFENKFSGILTYQEIVGSRHSKGLAQIFSSSHLALPTSQARHGVLTELCKQEICCRIGPYCSHLKLVVPISTFLLCCEIMWTNLLLRKRRNKRTFSDMAHFSLCPFKGRPYAQPSRSILKSNDLGVLLVGRLKISSPSGKLQLTDATGSIDVIIPGSASTLKNNSFYEVSSYDVIVEGDTELVYQATSLETEPISCKHIFCFTQWENKKNLSLCAHFQSKDVNLINAVPFHTCDAHDDDGVKELINGIFHLIWVDHKYPIPQKSDGDPVLPERSSLFVEAVILPWNLILSGKYEPAQPDQVLHGRVNKSLEHSICEDHRENLPSKTHKTLQESLEACTSDSILCSCSYHLDACSSFPLEQTDWNCQKLGSPQFSCLATYRVANKNDFVISGKLYCTKSKTETGSGCNPSTRKILMEFNSENLFKYQMLQIGYHYIIKHQREGPCCLAQETSTFSGGKVISTSRMLFWSLSFSPDEIATSNCQSDDCPLAEPSINSKGALIVNEVQSLQKKHTCYSPNFCSDVHLHLSVDAAGLLSLELNNIRDGCILRSVIAEETSDDHPHISFSTPSLSCGILDSNNLFPEGPLVSIVGYVVSIDTIIQDDMQNIRLSQGSTSSISVLAGDQRVSIAGSLNKYRCPVGFGLGVNATFHRILKMRGTNRFVLTPVSFIVINSILAMDQLLNCSTSNLSASYMAKPTSLDNIPTRMISELNQCMDGRPVQLICRVVAVHVLVLEKTRNCKKLQNVHRRPNVEIPLACFLLDDGSSSCFCWANNERASTLLRLHEELPFSNDCTLGLARVDHSSWKTTMHHLERLLAIHQRITVTNHGSMLDAALQDFSVYVSSDNFLSSSDQSLLKLVTLNAGFGKLRAVVGGLLDSNAIKQLKKDHLIPKPVQMPLLPNVWATEVSYTNSVSEAYNMIQELLN